jgi:mannose-1-phosphate guanylyltransferase / mannose-6-phosphate isomerase
MTSLRPVVLSGGSGTRLWPLSTPDLPKQFVSLFGDRSLFHLTVDRVVGIPDAKPPIVVTGSGHLALVEQALSSLSVDDSVIVVEPDGRNTAPAAIAAALIAEDDDILVIVPSDHLVADVDGFRAGVAAAARHAADGAIVTFGIEPTRPETGYGYIEIGDSVGGEAAAVRRFTEKPDVEEARSMAGDGRHLWNSGMFVARADRFVAEARVHCPTIIEGVEHSLPPERDGTVHLGRSFESVEAISIDYAIMEKTDRALIVPLDVGWSDVGSYQSLLEASPRDDRGNHISGEVALVDVEGSLVMATARRVTVVGLSEVVVVETEDAVLVIPLDRSQEVRDIAERVERD